MYSGAWTLVAAAIPRSARWHRDQGGCAANQTGNLAAAVLLLAAGAAHSRDWLASGRSADSGSAGRVRGCRPAGARLCASPWRLAMDLHAVVLAQVGVAGYSSSSPAVFPVRSGALHHALAALRRTVAYTVVGGTVALAYFEYVAAAPPEVPGCAVWMVLRNTQSAVVECRRVPAACRLPPFPSVSQRRKMARM